MILDQRVAWVNRVKFGADPDSLDYVNDPDFYLSFELLEWLEGKPYAMWIKHFKVGSDDRNQFWLDFDNPSDAVLFKLTWCGQ